MSPPIEYEVPAIIGLLECERSAEGAGHVRRQAADRSQDLDPVSGI